MHYLPVVIICMTVEKVNFSEHLRRMKNHDFGLIKIIRFTIILFVLNEIQKIILITFTVIIIILSSFLICYYCFIIIIVIIL